MKIRRLSPLLLTVAVVILAALAPAAPLREAAAQQQRVITINDLLSDVGRAAPGFGGMSYDSQGNLSVYLLDPAQREAAQAAIAGVFGAARVPVAGIRVLPARYSFADLRAWQDQARSLLAIPGVLSSGIDHKTNVLEVGVQDLRLSDEVHRALRNLGIPQEAVHIMETESIALQPTLRNRERPVEGGLNIDNNGCTLGYNALRGGVEGFVTASHCSTTLALVDGHLFYQTALIAADLIGVETVDPALLRQVAACPLGWLCRFSDVDFSQYANGVNFARGRIEKTQGVNTPQIPGNVNIVGNFQITGTGVALVGQTVNKVGRSSGWTQGVVTGICVDENMVTYIMLCQTEANYESAGGDSGSPVFQIPSSATDNVTLVGSHWGGYGSAGACPGGCTDEGLPMTTTGVFSPFGQVVGELGPLTVTAAVVGGILEEPEADAGARAGRAEGSSTLADVGTLAGGAAAAALVAAAGAGWYARRRLRQRRIWRG